MKDAIRVRVVAKRAEFASFVIITIIICNVYSEHAAADPIPDLNVGKLSIKEEAGIIETNAGITQQIVQ